MPNSQSRWYLGFFLLYTLCVWLAVWGPVLHATSWSSLCCLESWGVVKGISFGFLSRILKCWILKYMEFLKVVRVFIQVCIYRPGFVLKYLKALLNQLKVCICVKSSVKLIFFIINDTSSYQQYCSCFDKICHVR